MIYDSRYSQTLPNVNADEAQQIIQNLMRCLITGAINEPDPGLQRDRRGSRRLGAYEGFTITIDKAYNGISSSS